MKKPKGQQGSRFATQGHDTLPCLQAMHWIGRVEYHDPYVYDAHRPIDAKYMQAIEQGKRVFMTRDKLVDGRKQRLGYIDIHHVDDVSFGPDGFRCRIVAQERQRRTLR